MVSAEPCPECGCRAVVEATMVERGWWSAEVSCPECRGARVVFGSDTRDGAVRGAVDGWNRMGWDFFENKC